MTDELDRMDEIFMQRAMDLAILGKGQVSPNPLVGCVIVSDGKIIGEGWHKKYGEAHAEVNAVAEVKNKELLKESTVYVTLEPCSHFGKTPPCADLLIQSQVKRVVISNIDSNPLVSGQGIRKMENAGIEVLFGVLMKHGRTLNHRFFTFMEKKRPYIIVKWAETSDGFIAKENFDSKWISDEYSRKIVHKWRAEEDAVLIGSQTAFHDNPKLNVRDWSGKNPMRIVIDRSLKIPGTHFLLDQSQNTLVYNLVKAQRSLNLEFICLKNDKFIEQLVEDLYKRKMQSVIIEGGSETIGLFIRSGLWDEARVFISPQSFGKGIPSPKIDSLDFSQVQLQADSLRTYFNVNHLVTKMS